MNKQTLRKQALLERQSLIPEDYAQRCESVTHQALELVRNSLYTTVHLFLPIKKNKEVDTWPIYNWLINSPGHTPVVSKTHFKENRLSHHPMTRADKLTESRYGIPEPAHNNTIASKKLDLVFIPLLSFDYSGNRVGYGAGFYDRFLAECRRDTLKVGLAISGPFEGTIETNKFDIPLDLCITHKQVYDFRARSV